MHHKRHWKGEENSRLLNALFYIRAGLTKKNSTALSVSFQEKK